MASCFSNDGNYYVHLSVDGKLKIWNTSSNTFEQEFTPDFHLTSPCTCFCFVENDYTKNKVMTPKKKKRRVSESSPGIPDIAIGTTSGLLLIYSISKANVAYTVNSETGQSINCLSIAESSTVYSGADQNVLAWSLDRRKVIDKWKAGDEKISSILAIPDSKYIVTASKSIKLWNIKKKELLKTFTGHSSEVKFLRLLSHPEKGNNYIISGSKGDRILNCWSLSSSEKNAQVGFIMEDVVTNMSIRIEDGATFVAATVRSGVVHIYKHTLNGKLSKPRKPKSTIQVVTDAEASIAPLRIFGAIYKADDTLCIGYGTDNVLTFENVNTSSSNKLQCFIRQNPASVSTSKQEQASKSVTPIVSNDVHYLTPQKPTVAAPKRKNDLPTDIPMEQRLENLTLNKSEQRTTGPKTENYVHLLIQGLHTDDKNILKTVLYNKDENIIRNTVRKLPVTALVPLVQELSRFIQGKTLSSQIGSMWLKNILQMHTALLISNPEIPQLIGNTLGSIETRLNLLPNLNRLKGRLDLLLTQVGGQPQQESNQEEEPMLVYNDKDTSDSDDADDMQLDNGHVLSESENEWEEEKNSEDEKDSGAERNSEEEKASQ